MPATIVDLTASSPVRGSESLPMKTVLKTAILHAQPERLRATLQEICDSSPEASRIAQSFLLVSEEKVQHKTIDRRNKIADDTDDDEAEDEDSSEPSDDDDENEDSDDANDEVGEGDDDPRLVSTGIPVIQTNGVKRLRSRFATCTNCSEEFDVTANGRYSCTWHPGEREPDYGADIWADHDEDCHGLISDLEDQCPEGFTYSCCERAGDEEGCRIGTHVGEETSHKRARY